MARFLANTGKQVRRQDIETLFLHRLQATELGIGIAERGVVEIRAACLALLLVEIAGQVLRDEAIEQHAEHIALEVPSIHAVAQIVGDAPDGLVELGALGFFVVIHDAKPPVAAVATASAVLLSVATSRFQCALSTPTSRSWRPVKCEDVHVSSDLTSWVSTNGDTAPFPLK
ncbi:hypothetical protein SAMN05428977_1001139 [Nitrosomonas sp. Nm166]|nr:hypothetical protein SAMN05428977_1001139 [Nitrosomonas sp. Nm166]